MNTYDTKWLWRFQVIFGLLLVAVFIPASIEVFRMSERDDQAYAKAASYATLTRHSSGMDQVERELKTPVGQIKDYFPIATML